MKLNDWLRGSKLYYADLALIAAVVVGSFALRLNLEQLILDYLPALSIMLFAALLIKPWVYRRFGLYERVWAYASIEEMKLIVRAVTAASLFLAAAILALHFLGVFARLARSVLVIDWLASLAAVGALRFGLRLLAENPAIAEEVARPASKRVLVVGAGDAGALVVRELQKNPQLGLTPAAFLDDDPEKIGHKIHGVLVVGRLADLPQEARKARVDEVILAIPSASGSLLRQVAESCRQHKVPFRTMPGIYELIGGTVSVSRLRKVDITDLLRRQPARIDRQRVAASLKGKRILVTGAGGSIASELSRQLARWGPAQLVLLGHGENSIFEISLELDADNPKLDLLPIIADIRDAGRFEQIIREHKPNVIFHTAAHKHVPLMELNVVEAVTNNIAGTRNVVAAANKAGVERLVMISTDKAIRPTSVMGATKRVAEWIVLDAAQSAKGHFSVVRFGNVLGSRGSVVPLFEKQIAAGGPVTVTHPQSERYFMTIPEAVHLVLQASTFEDSGRMYMLNMGEPVRITDLAEDLIRLSGLAPGEDIEIVYSGLRPGEKLSEELSAPGLEYLPTAHPDISRVEETQRLAGKELAAAIDDLLKLADAGEKDALIQTLDNMLPDAEIGRTPPPELTSLV